MRSRFPKRPCCRPPPALLAFCASSARRRDSAARAEAGHARAVDDRGGPTGHTCDYDAGHKLAWVFQHPEAMLFDASGTLVVRHGTGPSWEALDGSRITGKKLAEAPSARPGSIPQLLLAATPAATDAKATAGTLAGVRFVQRLDTAGGMPPDATCSTEHAVGRFPYFARYVFLK